MNTRVAKYAPKTKKYLKSISLEARVKTAAGIYNCMYHFFWTEVMNALEVGIDIYLESHLFERDNIKLRKSISENDHAHMAKRKDNEHAKVRTELEKMFKDIAKNMEYGSHIGYKEGDRKPDEKKERGGEKIKKEEEV